MSKKYKVIGWCDENGDFFIELKENGEWEDHPSKLKPKLFDTIEEAKIHCDFTDEHVVAEDDIACMEWLYTGKEDYEQWKRENNPEDYDEDGNFIDESEVK